MRDQLDSFIASTTFNNWKNEVEQTLDSENIDSKLEVPVLIRSENNPAEMPPQIANNSLFNRSRKDGVLESNFDCDLHKVLVEVTYWQKI